MKETDIAWAAGFFDGEGCVSLHRASGGFYKRADRGGRFYWKKAHCVVACSIGQTQRDVLVHFRRIVQCGAVLGPYQPTSPNSAPCWNWQATGAGALGVLRLLMPYLVRKRAQAEAAIEGRKPDNSRGVKSAPPPPPAVTNGSLEL